MSHSRHRAAWPASATCNHRSGRTVLTVLALFVVGGVAAAATTSLWWGSVTSMLGMSESRDWGSLQLAEATKGPFRVTVSTKGSVDSLNNVKLVSQVEGSTTIIEIVDEGQFVHAG